MRTGRPLRWGANAGDGTSTNDLTSRWAVNRAHGLFLETDRQATERTGIRYVLAHLDRALPSGGTGFIEATPWEAMPRAVAFVKATARAVGMAID